MLDEQGVPLQWWLQERLYANILESYRPRRLDTRGVLFRAESPNKEHAHAFDDSLGWRNKFAAGLEVKRMTTRGKR